MHGDAAKKGTLGRYVWLSSQNHLLEANSGQARLVPDMPRHTSSSCGCRLTSGGPGRIVQDRVMDKTLELPDRGGCRG